MFQRLFVAALLSVTASVWPIYQALAEEEGFTSEERPPVVCDPGRFMSRLTCSGPYCDNVGMSCSIRVDANGNRIAWGNFGEFGSYFSEENNSGGRYSSGIYRCPANTAIAGFACKGSYCDNVSLYCVHTAGVQLKNCRTDAGTISEEGGGTLGLRDNEVAVAMMCSGKYCDNLTLHVCDVR